VETSAADAGQATDFGVDLRGYLYTDDQAGVGSHITCAVFS
jgi:hypothetical protein